MKLNSIKLNYFESHADELNSDNGYPHTILFYSVDIATPFTFVINLHLRIWNPSEVFDL